MRHIKLPFSLTDYDNLVNNPNLPAEIQRWLVEALAVEELDCSPLQKHRVNFTIEKFGLDHYLLNRRRKEVWDTCRALYNRHIQCTQKAEDTGSVRAETQAENAATEILYLIHETAEFSSVARAALITVGTGIARRLACAVGLPKPNIDKAA